MVAMTSAFRRSLMSRGYGSFAAPPEPPDTEDSALLIETGDVLLLESGDRLLLE